MIYAVNTHRVSVHYLPPYTYLHFLNQAFDIVNKINVHNENQEVCVTSLENLQCCHDVVVKSHNNPNVSVTGKLRKFSN